MTVIRAEDASIDYDTLYWRVYPVEGGEKPIFEFTRGNSMIFYTPEFAAEIGLPETRFPVDNIYAVLIGYHEPSERWMLGIHCSSDPNATPSLRMLARWEKDNPHSHAAEAQQAARALASQLGCPLKVFGARKLPVETDDLRRSGLTGPLSSHIRERLETPLVEFRVNEIKLPLEGESFVLFRGKNGLVLKQGRPAGGGKEAPVFNMVEFNARMQRLRLIPPTGLLGTFLESSAQEVLYDQILNVEFRISTEGEQKTGGVYLTVPSESLLLIYSMGGENSTEEQITEDAAVIIANALSCPLVKTRVERADSSV